METCYAPGESPAELDESFAIICACAAIVLAAIDNHPDVDKTLCEIFDDLARRPDARREIETGLEVVAQAALEARIRAELFHNEPNALAAELAASAGDASTLAVYGASIADRLGLDGPARALALSWAPVAVKRAGKLGADDDLATDVGRLVAAIRASVATQH